MIASFRQLMAVCLLVITMFSPLIKANENAVGCRQLSETEFESLKVKENHVSISTANLNKNAGYQNYRGRSIVNGALVLISGVQGQGFFSFLSSPDEKTVYKTERQNVVRLSLKDGKYVTMLLPPLKKNVTSVYCKTNIKFDPVPTPTQIDLYDVVV